MTTRNLDITPTWSGLLPVLVELAAGKIDSSPSASETAWAELRRMAGIADGVVEATRDKEPLRLHLSRAKFKFEYSAMMKSAGRYDKAALAHSEGLALLDELLAVPIDDDATRDEEPSR
jgi:hypothetical protein